MTRREQILAAAVLVLAGIVAGVLLVLVTGDDDDPDTQAGAPSTTTSAADSTTTVASSTTSTSTSTTPSSTTSTTAAPTTTTEAPPPPVADADSGEVLGLEIGSPFEQVLDAMTAVYGAPDSDTGWNGGCPLDGGPDDHERRISFGNLSLRFDRWEQPAQLAGWRYQRGAAGSFDPDGPSPDDIVLHPGVSWNQTGAEVAAVLGVDMETYDGIFGITFIITDGADYRAEGLDGTTPFDYVGYRNADICE
ncbi:MAG: hypothetical protein R2707_03225 [Acidimicrobiales bacterium]